MNGIDLMVGGGGGGGGVLNSGLYPGGNAERVSCVPLQGLPHNYG